VGSSFAGNINTLLEQNTFESTAFRVVRIRLLLKLSALEYIHIVCCGSGFANLWYGLLHTLQFNRKYFQWNNTVYYCDH